MPDAVADFFLDAPLYKPVRLRLDGDQTFRATAGDTLPRRLSAPCRHKDCCHEVKTTWGLQYLQEERAYREQSGPAWHVSYRCILCSEETMHFWYMEHAETVNEPTGTVTIHTMCKIGQMPAWSIAPSKSIERALKPRPEDLALYRRALVCMSQSFGLGALVYLRRVVENTTNDLLDLVEKLAEAQNDEASMKAIATARSKKVASDKIDLVAKAVPATLKLSGQNPLALLYDDYSVGIHALSDAECLETALRLRVTFDHLFEHLHPMIAQAEEYKAVIESMKKAPKKVTIAATSK